MVWRWKRRVYEILHLENLQGHGRSLRGIGRESTHCNAGALATAEHGTTLGIIRSAVEVGKQILVIVGETRPLLQGARLRVWETVQEKIPVTLITDNMTGYLMSRGEIDVVVVGTDRVAANGDVANKDRYLHSGCISKTSQHPILCALPIIYHRSNRPQWSSYSRLGKKC